MNIILNAIHCKWIRLHTRTYSRMKTHYDTLEVSPKSTQDEIKTSYYKLSMQYHPDKNKSEVAKKKFQNISEAYEVLGNHQARKRYDRSVMVKQHEEREIFRPSYEHVSVYKSKTHPMSNKHFNFDVWYKMHYRDAFARRRSEEKIFKTEQAVEEPNTDIKVSLTSYVVTFILTYIIIVCGFLSNDYDIPREKITTK